MKEGDMAGMWSGVGVAHVVHWLVVSRRLASQVHHNLVE